jgi:hypothetical protein
MRSNNKSTERLSSLASRPATENETINFITPLKRIVGHAVMTGNTTKLREVNVSICGNIRIAGDY